MEKVLRSIINVDGEIEKPDLQRNLFYLHDSNLNFLQEEDQQIWEFVRDFASANASAPSINSVRDYFEKERKIEVLDRLEEIRAVNRLYDKSDFESLVRDKIKEQNIRETSYLLKDASHILTNSLEEDGTKYEGYRDALRYIAQRSDDLLRSDGGHLVRSDITEDAREVKKEFDNTLSNRQNAWGRGTGLDPIDTCCRGVKPGELWVHAGFTGELKCLPGDATIFDHSTKRRRSIKEMFESESLPEVTSLYKEGEKPLLRQKKSSHIQQNGVRDVYDLKLKSGKEVGSTDNHRFFTPKGWKELGNLKEGDWVAVPKKMDVPNPTDVYDNSEVELIGYLLGDGTVKTQIRFFSETEKLRQNVKNCLLNMGFQKGQSDYITPNFSEKFPNNRVPYIGISQSSGNGNSEMVSPVKALLDKLGLWGTDSSTKFIPDEFFGLPEHQIELLLGALWATDGSCSTSQGRKDITYSTASKGLALDVQSLLLRLGIRSTVKYTTIGQKDYYCVRVVTNPSKIAFCEQIRVPSKEDRFAKLLGLLKNGKNEGDNTKWPACLFDDYDDNFRVQRENGQWSYASTIKGRSCLTGKVLSRFASIDPSLNEHYEGDIRWERIERIEYRGQEMTYDLSVPEDHSFVVNDIITHNTTFALNWAYKTAFIFKYNVYYYSLEMPVEQVRRIIYVMHSNHPKWRRQGYEPLTYRMIRDGVDTNNNKITQKQIDFFNLIVEDVENGQGSEYGHFFVECPDRGATIPHIKNRVEMVHQNTPIHLLFIDHFGLVQGHRNLNDYYQELNSIVREAKATALNFNRGEKIPIVALHQINREGKKEARKNDGKYNLQALADANEVERSSDVITYTYLNENYRARNETLIGCLKNRDNPHFDPFVAKVNLSNRFIKNLISTTNGSANIGLNGNEPDFDLED